MWQTNPRRPLIPEHMRDPSKKPPARPPKPKEEAPRKPWYVMTEDQMAAAVMAGAVGLLCSLVAIYVAAQVL